MRSILSFVIFVLFIGSNIQSQNYSDIPKSTKINAVETLLGSIKTSIDLTNIVEDKAPVTIDPEVFKQDTVTYRLPKVIPGTYKISDFGAFIDDFKVYDYSGEEMDFTKTDTNSWLIPNATELDRISYWVNDTYDVENTPGLITPFSPSGTNIELENVVLNLPGFIGYFQDFESNQYHLDITSPSDFKSSSALQIVSSSVSEDGSKITTKYYAPRYFDITDNPAMYGNFDIEEFQIGDIKIVFSVYSPNNIHSAKDLKETIFKMMEAQKTYMGDINSTARYDIFLYLSEMNETSPTGFGALEHHTSTVVVMPEQMPFEALASSLIDIVSHEFFHIVTPLTIHSEDIILCHTVSDR
jgi:predicted metalloprotease with PDZ domain